MDRDRMEWVQDESRTLWELPGELRALGWCLGRQIKEFTLILRLEKKSLEGLKLKSHMALSVFSMVYSGEMLRR